MGCCQSNINAIKSLEEELNSLKRKKAAYNDILSQNSSENPTSLTLSGGLYDNAYEEQLWALKFLKNLVSITGDDKNNAIDQVIKNIRLFCESQEKSDMYLFMRLDESNLVKHSCNRLEEVAQNIKNLDNKKALNIKSKLQSVEQLIQGKYSVLIPMLDSIKEREMEYSSNRGGSIESMLKRLHNRAHLEKELEILQTKLEDQQYQQLKKEKDDEIKILEAKIAIIKNEMNQIERAWEMVKMNFESDPKEVKALEDAIKAKSDMILELKKQISATQNLKDEIIESKKEIENLTFIITNQDSSISELTSSINHLNNEKLKLQEESEIIPILETRIRELQSQNVEKRQVEQTLEFENGDLARAIEEVTEKTSHELRTKEEAILVLQDQMASRLDDIQNHRVKRTDNIKKQLTIRLTNALKEVPNRLLQKWKWVVFHKEKPILEQPSGPFESASQLNDLSMVLQERSMILGDISMINTEENSYFAEELQQAKDEIEMFASDA